MYSFPSFNIEAMRIPNLKGHFLNHEKQRNNVYLQWMIANAKASSLAAILVFSRIPISDTAVQPSSFACLGSRFP